LLLSTLNTAGGSQFSVLMIIATTANWCSWDHPR